MNICDETGMYVSTELVGEVDRIINKLMDDVLPEQMTRLEYLVLKDFFESTVSYKLMFELLERWDKEDIDQCLGINKKGALE